MLFILSFYGTNKNNIFKKRNEQKYKCMQNFCIYLLHFDLDIKKQIIEINSKDAQRKLIYVSIYEHCAKNMLDLLYFRLFLNRNRILC